MGKVFDIVAPKDKWERYYAKMEHQRIGWRDLWQPTTFIEVFYDDECAYCGKRESLICERCGEIADRAER